MLAQNPQQKSFNDRIFHGNASTIKKRYQELAGNGKSTQDIISLIAKERSWNSGYVEYHIVYMRNRNAIGDNPNDRNPGSGFQGKRPI